MKDNFDFIHLLAKLNKAFNYAGIKILKICADQKTGFLAHIEHENKQYGLFILETTTLEDSLGSVMDDSSGLPLNSKEFS